MKPEKYKNFTFTVSATFNKSSGKWFGRCNYFEYLGDKDIASNFWLDKEYDSEQECIDALRKAMIKKIDKK